MRALCEESRQIFRICCLQQQTKHVMVFQHWIMQYYIITQASLQLLKLLVCRFVNCLSAWATIMSTSPGQMLIARVHGDRFKVLFKGMQLHFKGCWVAL